MDQYGTWYGVRPKSKRHCVRWGPSSPVPPIGAQQPPLFDTCLLWPKGRPSQQLLSSCWWYTDMSGEHWIIIYVDDDGHYEEYLHSLGHVLCGSTWLFERYVSDNSNICKKNCSLYIVLTATDQKPQKLQKGTINHTNIAWKSILVWLIVPFCNFCGFWIVAVNTVYRLQFFYIYNLLFYCQI